MIKQNFFFVYIKIKNVLFRTKRHFFEINHDFVTLKQIHLSFIETSLRHSLHKKYQKSNSFHLAPEQGLESLLPFFQVSLFDYTEENLIFWKKYNFNSIIQGHRKFSGHQNGTIYHQNRK